MVIGNREFGTQFFIFATTILATVGLVVAQSGLSFGGVADTYFANRDGFALFASVVGAGAESGIGGRS